MDTPKQMEFNKKLISDHYKVLLALNLKRACICNWHDIISRILQYKWCAFCRFHHNTLNFYNLQE